MSKGPRGGKKKTGRRSPVGASAAPSSEPPSPSPPPAPAPSHLARAGGHIRGMVGAGAYAAGTEFFKYLFLCLGSAGAIWGALYYFGVDVRPYLPWAPPQRIETGSITKEPSKTLTDEQAKRIVECEVAKDRKVVSGTDRRKVARVAWESCKAEPVWFRTVEQVCAPKAKAYRDLKKEVEDAQAIDCAAVAAGK